MPFVPDTKSSSSFIADKKDNGIFSRLSESYGKIASGTGSSLRDAWLRQLKGQQTIGETAIQNAGSLIGGATEAVMSTGIETAKEIAPKTTAAIGEQLSTDLKNTNILGTGVSIPDAIQKLSALAEKHPVIAADISGVVNVLSAIPVARAAVSTAKTLKAGVSGVVKSGAAAVDRSGIPSAISTGVDAGAEAITEAGAVLQRGVKAIGTATEKKAAQSALPDTVRNLYRAGVPEETITRVIAASPATKSFLGKMVDVVQSRLKGTAPRARALDVAGEVLTDTASKLSQTVKAVGAKLGDVKRLLRGEVIDLTETQAAIVQDINDLQLSVVRGKIIAPKGVPVDSDVLNVLNDVYASIGSGSDASIIDLLRTTLNKSFNAVGTPFGDNSVRLLTKYKDLSLKAISGVSTEYGALAAQYSEQIQALKKFTELIGFKGSIEDIGTQTLKAGEVTRRMLGQASARPIEIIDELLAQAKKAGIDFDGNFDDLVRFADDLDDIAGLTQTTGVQGAVQRAGHAVVGNIKGVVSNAIEGAMKLGAPGAAEKLDALQNFFKGLPK